MISKNQCNLLSCKPLGQPDLNISADQDIFMVSRPRPKKCSLTFSESTGTWFCRAPSPSPQAGEFLNWSIYWWAGHDCQGKDLQLPLKMPSQPPRINLCSAHMEMDVLFPQTSSGLASLVPGTRAGLKLHTLGIVVTPCFTGYQHELHFPSLQTHWSNFNFQCTAIKN